MSTEEKINRVMKEIGGNGPFQKWAFIMYAFSTSSIGFVLYDLGYLELMPTFVCSSATNPSYTCKEVDFCNVQGVSYSIDWSSPDSLHNWVEKLGLICKPSWQVGLIGSAMFTGWTLTLLWLPQFGDKYGRWKIFFISNIANLALYTVLMLSHNLWLTVGALFFIGCLESIRISIGYNYCMELMYSPYRTFYGTAWNVNEALVYFWATIYFAWVAKEWFPFIMIGYSLAWVATIGVYFYPESPYFLIQKERYDEAAEVFARIAKWNGKPFHLDQDYFLKTAMSDSET